MHQYQQTTSDPRSLKPNPWNTNHVDPVNEAKIDESVKRFGMFKPIIVRELIDGVLEIIGGEHRNDSAIRLGLARVPIINLGKINDEKAKEIGIVDNGRYGSDDTLQLAALMESLGGAEELASFMPYSDVEFQSIFSSVNIALDDLDIDDDAPPPTTNTPKPVATHQLMRFKVPAGDVATITAAIERVMKTQRFTEEDSLSNAGNALVHIFQRVEV